MKEHAVNISICDTTGSSIEALGWKLLKKHLIAGLTFNNCLTKYWNGGQIITRSVNIIHAITYYDNIDYIEKELPDNATIIGVCHNAYVSPKVEKWLTESIR